MEEVARVTDRLLVMDHGGLRMDNSPREVFRHAWELQQIGLGHPPGDPGISAPSGAGGTSGLQRVHRGAGRPGAAPPEGREGLMLKDITLGQFFPGKTVIHRLDPRTKLLMTVLYLVALFVANSWVSYGLVLAFLITAVSLSRIRPKTLLRGMKPIVIIVVLTAVLNLFYTGGDHVLARFWGITITWEGVRTAIFMASRIIMLITGTFLLTYTTSPIALTDGLESLLGPLKKLRLPVHELSMMMCIALRFIPTLIEETDKIMSAQKARGADFETGSLLQRAKALVPILVPLFISAFRRADELATAMECRCYQGGEGRTKLKVLHYARRDYLTLFLGAALVAGVITLKSFGL